MVAMLLTAALPATVSPKIKPPTTTEQTGTSTGGSGPTGPKTKWVTITTDEEGDEIEINGAYKGTTPLRKQTLTIGRTYRITAVRDGYSVDKTVTISKSTNTVRIEFPSPKLTFYVTPANATLEVDGRTWACRNGEASGNVKMGSHRYTVSADGYYSESDNVTVKKSGSSVTVNLTRKPTSQPSPPPGNGSQNPQSFTVNGVTFEMVKVEGGTFTMGATSEQGSDADSDEKPAHSVTLSDYYIGKYEVTQAQWKAVMGNNPSYFKGDNLPVEEVSWDDCQTFVTKLNQLTGKKFRLQTEAEWEYAARGGNKSKGYKYSGSNDIGRVAWYSDNSGSTTHPVGTKQANELGLYDMSGNVWEWCQDWYGNYSSLSQTNPTGPTSGSFRVLRGGGWNYGATSCRVSYRAYYSPTYGYYYIGFRLALSQ